MHLVSSILIFALTLYLYKTLFIENLTGFYLTSPTLFHSQATWSQDLSDFQWYQVNNASSLNCTAMNMATIVSADCENPADFICRDPLKTLRLIDEYFVVLNDFFSAN
jgi:hypothetical protein